ncbi:hypothetical protein ANN_03253 [Periplaneta americana]|uniref:Tc1-like transposase DDE domain-containing protein n=1 Tax=Periplaneta americana TaxID=6978 RepID=A0ABQ8TYG6_PERAM|nr:hypothetical protein ANN_03253 [Periplaneta americana]
MILCVWRCRGEHLIEPNILEIDRFGGGSIMVWANISLETKTALTVVPDWLNAIGYVENILQHILPVMECMDAGFVLMHDNVRAHIVTVSMNFLNEHEIPVMDWPAISPDSNLIEHVWDMLERRVCGRYRSLQKLKRACKDNKSG